MKKTKLSNSDYNRKLEHQIYLAQEHPAKIYDLTDCNINQIPKGVFTYCKVLRKYSLNLSENNLNSMSSGGNLEDLSNLGALILSYNLFKSLPSDILKLTNLKKLLIDNNKLQKFPVILTDLPNLTILSLENNSIKLIPKEIKTFKTLENLNLSRNPITILAPEICEIPTLTILKIDCKNIKNISPELVMAGFNSIWKHLCELRNIPFRKINERNTDIESSVTSETHSSDLRYTKMGEEIEREIMEHEQNLCKFEFEDRRKSMDRIKKNIELENDMISEILSQKKYENDRLLYAIKFEEVNTNELINKIFEYNNNAKKREELRNRIPDRNLNYADFDFSLTSESKCEVLNSMKKLFQSSSDYSRQLSNTLNNFSNDVYTNDCMFTESCQQLTFEQDNEQKLAFKQLHHDKDAQVCRLKNGIVIIEKKLQQLSVEDMIEGSLVKDLNRTDRSHLVDVLQQLKLELVIREKFLDDKIEQIEKTRQNHQEDFWIVQYQNLLDDKSKLDYEVEELLKMADMKQWISVFLKYGYTIDMMLDLTMDDLNQLEIKPENVKTKFLAFLNEWKFNPIKSSNDSDPSAPKMSSSNFDKENLNSSPVPSAPPLKNTSETSVLLARKEAECCICLTYEARILLLNCGHVCCCKDCSFTVKLCPLCRQDIIQRVNLEFSI